QYFPKGSDFREISSSSLRRVEDEINQRPRKTLNYKSPSELETKLAA
ncbi:MAG: IS30 family transposase, partial [Akkermansiaceae bacterium]